MKLPEFDAAHRYWDRHKAFYTCDGIFTQFETGDVMMERRAFDPDERRLYEKYNLFITASADNAFKFFLPDSTPVPKAWINDSIQYLIVDMDTLRAYPFGVRYGSMRDKLPKHAVGASIYFPNAKAEPITTGAIRVSRPDKELLRSSKSWLSDVRALCKAVVDTNDRFLGLRPLVDPVVISRESVSTSPEEYVSKLLAPVALAELHYNNTRTIKTLADDFYTLKRINENVPYLIAQQS